MITRHIDAIVPANRVPSASSSPQLTAYASYPRSITTLLHTGALGIASGVVALLVLVRWALSSYCSFKEEEESSRLEVDAPVHEWVAPEASKFWQRRKR